MSETKNSESNIASCPFRIASTMFVNATYRVMRIMDEVKAAPEIVALGDVEVE